MGGRLFVRLRLSYAVIFWPHSQKLPAGKSHGKAAPHSCLVSALPSLCRMLGGFPRVVLTHHAPYALL